MSALAALDSLVPDMIRRAREMPTDELRAMYAEGTALGSQSTLWTDTMVALATVLSERVAAEATSSEVTR